MIYAIRQRIEQVYAQPVTIARHMLRLRPAERPGQTVLATELKVHPRPTTWREGWDFFGNRTAFIMLDQPHDELVIETTARVKVQSPPPPQTPLDWRSVAAAAAGWSDLGPRAPVHGLFASRRIGLHAETADYAAASFGPGRDVFAAARDLAQRIKAEWEYDPDATEVSTPLLEAFRQKAGVCQDFAHIMISGLRGLGVPALYVSGYLRTLPPPGQPRLEGADAMHAWVSIWCGPDAGWRGFDPTNGKAADDDYVIVAMGRDYADAAPVGGVVLSAGHQGLKTSVDVVPEGETA